MTIKKEAKQKIKTMSRLGIIQDLILHILLCLPVKALLRFRCLSKELYHEIDSPAFSKAHLYLSFKTKPRHKLVIYRSLDRKFYVADFDDKFSELAEAGNLLQANDILGDDRRLFEFGFCGSCNGLLLLSSIKIYPHEVLLWLFNPFTRECKKLPDCPGISNDLEDTVFGFGYDSIGDDYKIVRIERFRHVQIWVFSLASHTWRNLVILPDCHETCRRIRWNSSSVFAYGASHWLSTYTVEVDGRHYQEIVSFDMSKEVFVNLIPSISYQTDYVARTFLDVLGGRLVFGGLFTASSVCACDLYYVVKCGSQFAWKKLAYSIVNLNTLQSRNGNNIEETTLESFDTVRLMIGNNAMDILYRILGIAIFCCESLVSPHAS